MTRPALNHGLRSIGLALLELEEDRRRRALEFAGPSPSPFGFALERAAVLAFDSTGRPIKPRMSHHVPVRDDSHLWRACGRDFAPDYAARFEAVLSEPERMLLMSGSRQSASDAAAELGMSPKEWRASIQRVRRKIARVRR